MPAALPFWLKVRHRAEDALASGAMHSFECALELAPDAGIDFVVRRATKFPPGETAAGRKPDAPTLARNPFLTPEPDLVVGDVGHHHIALLNKFSVLREHLLLVTRKAIDQQVLLDEDDFGALSMCLDGAEVLGFYNGGKVAGASQAHKHLQLVTLPLAPWSPVPLSPAIEREPPALPFRHARTRLAPGDIARPPLLRERYRALLDAAGVRCEWRDGRECQCAPYNLVLTRDWMLVVPRSVERFEGISINSLAFAGSFFVRDAAHLETIARAGPMKVLQSVATP